ncbi:ArsR/SmtB family transcription factor [Subtercola lobariae]|uniref:HTH arsR-type domain-containing protein n=1 Tax=Subtercola lobariae TaxID=1588641 RepID=A0A917AYZ8_9MICO|nr:metalloregulator ArsR/SmtB family transcription factor [Subtercola lobariae]GGF11080.1 hypothetical protein GCM10011399_01100 [Subtercola lobariae]
MADIFSVIADPTRRHVLSLLLERYVGSDSDDDSGKAAGDAADAPANTPMGEVSVSEIVELLELSQPTVSKHLKVLRDAGLVSVREVGQHRYYTLESAPLEEVEDWLIPFLSADFDEAAEEDGIDFEAELDEVAAAAGSAVSSAAASADSISSDVTEAASKVKSQAALAGERVGQTVATAAERARSLFGEASRRFPTISRSSD